MKKIRDFSLKEVTQKIKENWFFKGIGGIYYDFVIRDRILREFVEDIEKEKMKKTKTHYQTLNARKR